MRTSPIAGLVDSCRFGSGAAGVRHVECSRAPSWPRSACGQTGASLIPVALRRLWRLCEDAGHDHAVRHESGHDYRRRQTDLRFRIRITEQQRDGGAKPGNLAGQKSARQCQPQKKSRRDRERHQVVDVKVRRRQQRGAGKARGFQFETQRGCARARRPRRRVSAQARLARSTPALRCRQARAPSRIGFAAGSSRRRLRPSTTRLVTGIHSKKACQLAKPKASNRQRRHSRSSDCSGANYAPLRAGDQRDGKQQAELWLVD